MVKGNIAKIIKFSAVDGPGNRSAIFTQGCNLNCKFCHNPETIPFKSDEAKQMTASQVFEEIGNALNFIRGITVSGGECTLQKEFICELFKLAKEKGLDRFVDTNGSMDLSLTPDLVDITDYFMLDIKSADNEEHKSLCGAANEIILNNLNFLVEKSKLYEIRTVISPNMIDCQRTVEFASKAIAKYGGIKYKLIKYRPNGVRKEYIKDFKVPSNSYMEEMKAIAESNGVKDVIII